MNSKDRIFALCTQMLIELEDQIVCDPEAHGLYDEAEKLQQAVGRWWAEEN